MLPLFQNENSEQVVSLVNKGSSLKDKLHQGVDVKLGDDFSQHNNPRLF